VAVTDQLAGDGLDDSAPAPESAATVDAAAPEDPFDSPPTPDAAVGLTRRLRRRRRQRISKWDRPPDPHDWRFFVGNLGKVLIATGLLMFGFVAYQLWGTGIETARAQSALKNEFQELIEQRQTDPPTLVDAASSDGDPAQSDASDDAPTDPAQSDTSSASNGSTGVVVSDASPAADGSGSVGDTTATDTPLIPVDQDIPPIFRGDPLALLEIPAIGRSDIVVPGVSLNDLKDGPGHYPETPLPGQLGNASIAGHRTTYGAPFFDVDDLVPGDELIVTMLTGDQFVYEVTGIEIVSASDYWVVTTTDPTKAELTLTSCHPKYTARDRIVVHSVLNPAKSANVGIPTTPYFLEPDDEPIPGDDPVLVADAPTEADPALIDPADDADVEPSADVQSSSDGAPDDDNTGAADPELTPVEASDGSQSDDQDAQAAPSAPSAAAPAEVGDAFSQGWFDDRAAFVQIALWGLALTLISIGSYRISRRYRHDSFGFMVGIFPFLVALYFFFQNVNRLLPPGL
jgi:sortase A